LPVVVKPIDGNHGRAVSIRLESEDAIRDAFELAAKEGSGVVVERFVPGRQHRILVVGDKAVAAVRGDADVLKGDGASTIRELVDRANLDPRRGVGQTWVLTKIELNPIVLELLRRQGLTPDSVPKAGEDVLVQLHGDLTVDETDELHPEVAATCVLAAQTVGLDIAGLDVVAADVAVPLAEQGGAVIEVNASPGMLAHIKPLVGKPRPVGEAIVDQLFPGGDQGLVPLVAISGTVGRTETAALIARWLGALGHVVARADESGLYLGERRLDSRPSSHAAGARRALMNPSASAIVLETEALSVLEQGLAFDACQVAVVLGTEGAEAHARPGVEDRVAIDKAIRAPLDIVSPGGYAVLSAQDPVVLEMAQHCKGKTVLVGGSLETSPVREHVQAGGAALVRLDSQLVWCAGGEKPAQLDVGRATESNWPNRVEPLMAAAAALLALGVSRSDLQGIFNNSAY